METYVGKEHLSDGNEQQKIKHQETLNKLNLLMAETLHRNMTAETVRDDHITAHDGLSYVGNFDRGIYEIERRSQQNNV